MAKVFKVCKANLAHEEDKILSFTDVPDASISNSDHKSRTLIVDTICDDCLALALAMGYPITTTSTTSTDEKVEEFVEELD